MILYITSRSSLYKLINDGYSYNNGGAGDDDDDDTVAATDAEDGVADG